MDDHRAVPRVTQTVVVDAGTAEDLLGARHDLLDERAWSDEDEAAWDGDDPDGELEADGDIGIAADEDADVRTATFALARGPMTIYRRDVRAAPVDDGRIEVTETTRFRSALGPWGAVVAFPVSRALRRTSGRTRPRSPFWAPPEALDTRSGTVLGLLLTLALVAGYLGTVMTQTITFAADEFGRGTTAQGGALAAVRIGTLGSLVLVAMADRQGRRKLLLASLTAAILATVLGAFSPTLEVLGVSQTLARGFTTAVTLLLAVVAAEEMPAGARAYAISVMTMTGALGAGMAIWALPLADVGEQGWRILYVLPLLGLPVVARVRRTLPESLRFVRSHRSATVLRGHVGRLAAIGGAMFCAAAFGAPSSQLLNDFLRDERGFSAARISLFTILTSTPAGIALVAGGRLADTRGRRHVVAVGVAGGALLAAWGFTAHGWPLWAANLGGTMLGALAVPALGAYGPELFPTAARGKANGVLQLLSVAGSALGLVVAGIAKDRWGQLSDGIFLLLPLGLLVAVLALTVFPETARRELEDINPEDDVPGAPGSLGGAAAVPPAGIPPPGLT